MFSTLVFTDISPLAKDKRPLVQPPPWTSALLAFMVPCYVALYASLYLGGGVPRHLHVIPGKGGWDVVGQAYCSKSGASVAIETSSAEEFGVSLAQCQAQCSKNELCGSFTYGEWTQFLHHNQMRCQLYVECAAAGRMGMTIYVKHGSAVKPVAQSMPPLFYMTPIAPDMLALLVAQSSGGCSIVMAAITTRLFLRVKDSLNPFELLLALLHAANILILCVRQWKFCHAVDQFREGQMPYVRPSPLYEPPSFISADGSGHFNVDLTQAPDSEREPHHTNPSGANPATSVGSDHSGLMCSSPPRTDDEPSIDLTGEMSLPR